MEIKDYEQKMRKIENQLNSLTELEQQLKIIQERNYRVEMDKKWETSIFRIISICLITYLLASIVMYFIGVKDFLLNAFIPTIGYFLSTQSLPLFKKWWINNQIKNSNK